MQKLKENVDKLKRDKLALTVQKRERLQNAFRRSVRGSHPMTASRALRSSRAPSRLQARK